MAMTMQLQLNDTAFKEKKPIGSCFNRNETWTHDTRQWPEALLNTSHRCSLRFQFSSVRFGSVWSIHVSFYYCHGNGVFIVFDFDVKINCRIVGAHLSKKKLIINDRATLCEMIPIQRAIFRQSARSFFLSFCALLPSNGC